MSQELKKYHVTIIGAGLAGLTLGAILEKYHIDFTVLEIDPKPTSSAPHSGRTAALMSSSINVLKSAEIWDEIKDACAPLKTLRIIDDSKEKRDAQIPADFHAHEIDLEAFGHNVPNDLLRFKLISKLHDHIQFGVSMRTFEDGILTLNTGETFKTDLCVAADGKYSATRAYFDIPVTEKDYEQSAITCKINHGKPHENISTELHRSGGPCTFVPLPDPHQSSIVWVENTGDAEEILKLSKSDFIKALQERSCDVMGKISFETPPQSWPLKSLRAKRITAPRTAFIAEAAHVLSPIGAQGLNLSMRDVAVLAELIIDTIQLGGDAGSPSVLSAYEAARKSDVTKRAFAVGTLNRLVNTDNPILNMGRRTGLKIASSLPFLKHNLMREGLTANDVKSRFL